MFTFFTKKYIDHVDILNKVWLVKVSQKLESWSQQASASSTYFLADLV